MKTEEAAYYLYLLWCDRNVIYTGIAIDPHARLEQHQIGHPHGAKFTRRFKQLELVYQVKVGSRAEAQRLELKIKKLKKAQKEKLVKAQPSLTQLFELTGFSQTVFDS